MTTPVLEARDLARTYGRGATRFDALKGVSLAVHHLAAPEKAERLATELRDKVPSLVELHVSELGAAIGAHVGPGAVGVVVAPAPEGPAAEHPAPKD